MSGGRVLGRLSGVLIALAAVLSSPAGATTNSPPAPIWSGVYAGVHAGYGWADISYTFDTFFGPESFSHHAGDWFGGGHVGVQRQFGRLVAGVEISYSDLHLTDTVESIKAPGRFRQIEIDSLFLATVRLGYAADRWMAYVKGGYANADVETRVFIDPSTASVTSGREHGWTIGAGIELLCWRGFLVGLEYNYVHLGIGARDGKLPDNKPFNYSGFDDDIHTVTVRLSYLFGTQQVDPLK